MTSTTAGSEPMPASAASPSATQMRSGPAFQAFWLMRIGFCLVPILFGADKFAHMMVDWDRYLAPELQDWISPFSTVHQTMYFVGVVEIVAGLVVLLLPRIGGFVVALWLAGIIVNLALIGGYWDILMRDAALFVLALTFTRLARAFPAGWASDRLLSGGRRRK